MCPHRYQQIHSINTHINIVQRISSPEIVQHLQLIQVSQPYHIFDSAMLFFICVLGKQVLRKSNNLQNKSPHRFIHRQFWNGLFSAKKLENIWLEGISGSGRQVEPTRAHSSNAVALSLGRWWPSPSWSTLGCGLGWWTRCEASPPLWRKSPSTASFPWCGSRSGAWWVHAHIRAW